MFFRVFDYEKGAVDYCVLSISLKPGSKNTASATMIMPIPQMTNHFSTEKRRYGKDIYQDICYPVTKEFREKLYGEIERAYQEAKDKQKEESKDTNSQDKSNDKDEKKDGQAIGSGESLPFR